MQHLDTIAINWAITNAFLDCIEEGRTFSMI